MAEQDERERQQAEAEITSEENPIEEDELELSLGLRPIHIHPRPRTTENIPEISNSVNPNPNPATIAVSKRDVQALRRHEAKKKRELKRKASNNNNSSRSTWLGVEERERNSGYSPAAEDAGKCGKAPKLNASYWSPTSWWSWNPATVAGGGGFRPYQGQNGKFTPGVQNIVDGENNRQSISSGSSSAISDNYQSSSGPGATSSDVGSHSSHPHSQPSPPQVKKHFSSQVELCNNSPSNHTEPAMSSKQTSQSLEGGPTSSNGLSHSPTSSIGGPSSNKGQSPTAQSPSPKEAEAKAKAEPGKPPKPIGPTNQQQKLALAQMPCVSVTGNGPNGKTITGFLYRYTKAEVSIVCVCHGASFSPAGFVEHAGGVDVEHPLKHIRVVPFALG